MVAPSVKANINFLRRIAKCTSERKRVKYLQEAADDELLAIVEIAFNVLKGKLRLTNCQKNKLVQVANDARRLSRSRSAKSAREIIQKGGSVLLTSLLTPVLIEVGRYLLNNGA